MTKVLMIVATFLFMASSQLQASEAVQVDDKFLVELVRILDVVSQKLIMIQKVAEVDMNLLRESGMNETQLLMLEKKHDAQVKYMVDELKDIIAVNEGKLYSSR